MLEDRPVPARPTLVGREPLVALARDLIASGSDVDIVGSRDSGRSSVMDALGASLADAGASVVRLQGVRGLQGNPLAALHAAGFGVSASPDRRAISPLQTAMDALEASLGGSRAAILVDDADLLDDASAGALEAVARATRTPVVRTGLRNGARACPPSGYILELAPLRYDELEAMLTARLGAGMEAGTMSRVYAKSGGIPGLAVTMVELARRERRLLLRDGAWVTARGFWSPSLRGPVERHLAGLDALQCETLELITLIGVADLDTVLGLSGPTVLEELEAAGVVRIVPTGDRRLVTADPPLLAEFYRHETSTVRRLRLSGLVREALGSGSTVEAILADTPPLAPGAAAEGDALFVRLVHERTRLRRVVAEAEWRRSPSAAKAVAYVHALIADAEDPDALARAFDDTASAGGDAYAVAALASLRARWRAASGFGLDEALALLREETRASGGDARLAEATAVAMELAARGVPMDADERLALEPGVPGPVRVAVLAARMLLDATRGRFAAALATFDEIAELDPAIEIPGIAALNGMCLFGAGRYAEALAWAERGIDETNAQLDSDGMRAHSFVAALCLTAAGRYIDAEPLISTALALGEPTPLDVHDHLGALALASIVAVRRGNVALGEKLLADITASPAVGSVMGRLALAWSTAQVRAYRGQPSAAADLLAEHAASLREAGVAFWAGLALLVSIEIQPDDARIERAIESVPPSGSEFLDVHLAFLVARRDRDVDSILALTGRLSATGRAGLAVIAFRLAVEWLRESGDTTRAATVAHDRDAFIAELPAGMFDATRFFATAVNLTDREREISRLVAAGLTNPQIASRLVLSVRTVESHLHRIMRKTSVSNRQELSALIRSMAQPGGRLQG
jgi:DNA-binding CsgD family transcriptional regulator/tetratricopeptide (TPR) repeat protein